MSAFGLNLTLLWCGIFVMMNVCLVGMMVGDMRLDIGESMNA